MDLHPQAATEAIFNAHGDALTVVHTILDKSVQDVAARWDDRYPDLTRMYGGGLSANVRLVYRTMVKDALAKSSLRPSEGMNGGQHLYDNQGTRIRVRKRPVSTITPWLPRQVVAPVTETLFGTDLNSLSYEVAVFWTMNYGAKALGQTVLAAVADLDDWPNTKIYYEIPLPAPDLGGGGIHISDDDEGFDEDFGPDEGVGWGQ